MRKRRRINGLTGKRLIIAVAAIFLLTVVSRQNAFMAGTIVAIIIAGLAFMKYRHSNYIRHFDSPEELCREFCENRASFARYAAKIFGRKGYIVEMAPDNMKTSADMKLWKDGREYLITVIATEQGTMIKPEQIRALHLDMVECDSDEGFLVTCGCFDDEMAEQARQYDITLIDGKTLLGYIEK